jgi:DNA-directed RNA polymerase specialized sigma24 family protein
MPQEDLPKRDPLGSVTIFFNRLKAGEAAAAAGLWNRFFPRLAGLARKTLAGRPQGAADADDAVQSAFASFCQQAQAGAVEIADRSDLWNLLGLITKRKALAQIRRELAEKRGGGHVVPEAALTGPQGQRLTLDQAAAAMTAGDFDLHVAELLEQLEPSLREFAVLRAMGFTNREIAKRLECTERKVERKLQLIRLAWETQWPQ